MMIPSNRLLYLLVAIAVIGLLASFREDLEIIWQGMMWLAAGILLLDLVMTYLQQPVSAERNLPGSIPLGVSRNVTLRLHNTAKRPITLAVHDHFPEQLSVEGMPFSTSIAADAHADITYRVTANERGKLIFPRVQIHLDSRFGFWKRNIQLPVESETRVYPNFAAVSHYALMATDNKLSQMGIMKKRRRGEGQDFHQLREYREGDGLRQIDWKATSRTRKLISREYQDERDQEVIFLLDCGHRMTTKDGELSHFDHTLNAILLLSYVALKQGDSVGLATFSGESRWSPPMKGQHTIPLNNTSSTTNRFR